MSDTTFVPPLIGAVGRSWWLVLLRGLAAVVFGVLTLAWPGISLITLVWLYGAYAFADGVIALGAAFRGGSAGHRLWLVIGGLVSVVAGVAAFGWPGLTAYVLVILIGAWSLVRGGAEIAAGIMMRKEIKNEWMLILGGIVSILFGAAIFYAPGPGALALLWLIGGWAVVFGLVLIGLSFRLRRLPH